MSNSETQFELPPTLDAPSDAVVQNLYREVFSRNIADSEPPTPEAIAQAEANTDEAIDES